MSHGRPYDSEGAMMYIVCTLSVYCLGIVAFLLSYLCNKKADDADEIQTYLRYSQKQVKVQRKAKIGKMRNWVMTNMNQDINETSLGCRINQGKRQAFRHHSYDAAVRGDNVHSRRYIRCSGGMDSNKIMRSNSYPADDNIYQIPITEESLLLVDETEIPLVTSRAQQYAAQAVKEGGHLYTGKKRRASDASVVLTREKDKDNFGRSVIKDFYRTQVNPNINEYRFSALETNEAQWRPPLQPRTRRMSVNGKGYSKKYSDMHDNENVECKGKQGEVVEQIKEEINILEDSNDCQFESNDAVQKHRNDGALASQNEQQIGKILLPNMTESTLDIGIKEFGEFMTKDSRLSSSYDSDTEETLIIHDDTNGENCGLDDYVNSFEENDFGDFKDDCPDIYDKYDLSKDQRNAQDLKTNWLSALDDARFIEYLESPSRRRSTSAIINPKRIKQQMSENCLPKHMSCEDYPRRRSVDQYIQFSFVDEDDANIQHALNQNRRRKSTGTSKMATHLNYDDKEYRRRKSTGTSKMVYSDSASGYDRMCDPELYFRREEYPFRTLRENSCHMFNRRSSVPFQNGKSEKQRPGI